MDINRHRSQGNSTNSRQFNEQELSVLGPYGYSVGRIIGDGSSSVVKVISIKIINLLYFLTTIK